MDDVCDSDCEPSVNCISISQEIWSNLVEIHACSSHYPYSPVQLAPSPLYPGLQAQVKLPTVLVHWALGSHPPLFTAHSSTSTKVIDLNCGRGYISNSHTHAAEPISSEPRIAGTGEAPHSVGAPGIRVTPTIVHSTFINICKID